YGQSNISNKCGLEYAITIEGEYLHLADQYFEGISTMHDPFFRLLSVGLLGFGATCGLAANATPVDCGATVPSIRTAYFAKIGIGADYGPHYPCYNISGGAIAECVDRFGAPTNGVQADAKNNELESSVPLDLTQMQLAGFKSVRAYGDPAKVWIAM